jgi:hypothetical protein
MLPANMAARERTARPKMYRARRCTVRRAPHLHRAHNGGAEGTNTRPPPSFRCKPAARKSSKLHVTFRMATLPRPPFMDPLYRRNIR